MAEIAQAPPRILIIDDVYGRVVADRRNKDRADLCRSFLLRDVTGDETDKPGTPVIPTRPKAEAVFFRGQKPVTARVGDVVENDLEGCLRAIKNGWEDKDPATPVWSMVLIDLCFFTGPVTEVSDQENAGMPEGRRKIDEDPRRYFGLEILKHARQLFPQLPLALFSSMTETESLTLDYETRGGMIFIPKNDSAGFCKCLTTYGLLPDPTGQIAGRSRELLLALKTARMTGRDDRSVLLLGERGTGKEEFAKFIHRNHLKRGERRMITADLSTSREELLESLMFGILPGVATHVRESDGLIREAQGSDLFLDEIGNIPIFVQNGLLRVMQSGEVLKVGAAVPDKVDVRFISATNKPIEAMCAQGKFGPDLFDRLVQGWKILLPPLRDRMEDLPLLVEKIVHKMLAANTQYLSERKITQEAVDKLRGYDWPGNVRELEGVLHRALYRNPTARNLVPLHVELPEPALHSSTVSFAITGEANSTPEGTKTESKSQLTFDQLMLEIASFEARADNVSDWKSKYAALQDAYARLVARLLKAALELENATHSAGADDETSITNAVRIVTGPPLKTGKAYDLVKKFLKFSPAVLKENLKDPVLKKAYEKAIEERPSMPKGKKDDAVSTNEAGGE